MALIETEVEGQLVVAWLATRPPEGLLSKLLNCAFYFSEDVDEGQDIAAVDLVNCTMLTKDGKRYSFNKLREAWFIDRNSPPFFEQLTPIAELDHKPPQAIQPQTSKRVTRRPTACAETGWHVSKSIKMGGEGPLRAQLHVFNTETGERGVGDGEYFEMGHAAEEEHCLKHGYMVLRRDGNGFLDWCEHLLALGREDAFHDECEREQVSPDAVHDRLQRRGRRRSLFAKELERMRLAGATVRKRQKRN